MPCHVTYSIQTVDCDDGDTSLAFIYRTLIHNGDITTNSWYYRSTTGRYEWHRLTMDNIEPPPVQDAETRTRFREVFDCGDPQYQLFIDRIDSEQGYKHIRTMISGSQ